MYFINDQGLSLTHYGIKGMRWGVRRTPEQLGHRELVRKYGKAGAKNIERSKRSPEDAERHESDMQNARDDLWYGKKGAARIRKRVDKGRSRSSARSQEFATQVTIGILGSAAIPAAIGLASDPYLRADILNAMGSKLHSAANAARERNAQRAAAEAIAKIASSNARVVFNGDGYDILEGFTRKGRHK